jgi:hypothetical protein
VPIIAVILALAFYPQFGLRRSEPTVKSTLAAVDPHSGALEAAR